MIVKESRVYGTISDQDEFVVDWSKVPKYDAFEDALYAKGIQRGGDAIFKVILSEADESYLLVHVQEGRVEHVWDGGINLEFAVLNMYMKRISCGTNGDGLAKTKRSDKVRRDW
jgi:hypothetical protein